MYTVVNSRAKFAGNVSIYFQEGIDKVKDIEIRIFDASGREVKKVKKKEIKDSKAYSSNEMADDLRKFSYENTFPKYPFTVEYSYTVESKYAATIPTFSPYPFNNYVKTYITNSSYEIVGNVDDIAYKYTNVDHFTSNIDLSSYPTKISVSDLPIVEIGNYAPPKQEILPLFHYARKEGKFNTTDTKFDDWESYGTWLYNAYLHDKLDLSEDAKSIVQELIADAKSDYDKADNIYNYVVNNTRYVSIQLGEGGLEPFQANEVHEKKYGDCKALSNYTLALLKEADVNAFYVVIEAGSDSQSNFDTDFASIQQGNHAIIGVEIEGDTIYADCTSSNYPFGTISSFTDGRLAVGVNENGGKLIKTNKYSDEENQCKIQTNLLLNPEDKTLSIDYKRESQGCDISEKIWYTKETNEYIGSKALPHYYPQFSKETFGSIDVNYNSNVFNESFKIDTKKFITSAGNYLMLPLHIHKLELDIIEEENRFIPMYFKDGFKNSFETSITIPDGYEWAGGIEPQILESSFGTFELQKIEVDEKNINIHIQLITNSGYFPSEKIDEFNSWVSSIKDLENEKIIFRPL